MSGWLKVVGVDFETYYTGDYSVRTLGVFSYVNDPRFRAWAVAVADGERTAVTEPGAFPWREIHGLVWVSHNREFDKAVFERLQRDGVVSRDVRPSEWFCTAAACAFLQYPRDLAGACREVLGEEVDKTTRKNLKGQKGVDDLFGQAGATDAEREYAARDAVMCLRLWEKVGWRWPRHERLLFEETCRMGRTGLPVDWGMVGRAKAAQVNNAKVYEAVIPWRPALSIPQFEKACRDAGETPPATTAKNDENFQLWAEFHAGKPWGEWAAAMAGLRSANRMVRVLEAMESRRDPASGRMVYELKYYGASPGRWSGGGGLNVQNFNRKESGGLDVRKCVCAAPGQVLAVLDYSQIEARVLLWLAGDTATLKILEENPGMDMYEVHARATMGYREAEPLEKFCERTGALTRQLAKARVLGLGFRCGAGTFVRVAKIMAGLDIGFDEAKRIVNEYRASNPLVVALWEDLERRAWDAFEKGADLIVPFPCTEKDPRCGRHLYYRDLRRAAEARGLTAVVCGERVPLHGGILAENLTQGTARDVLASAWLRCVRAGFKPSLSVHDELVFELPEATVEGKLAEIRGIMEAPLPWAPGLPLRASGKLMKRYGK